MNLRDSVIIVTGSATGLGAAIVKQVAAKGARVVINYTKSEKEARETEAVCDYLDVESLVCRADVSVDADVPKGFVGPLQLIGQFAQFLAIGHGGITSLGQRFEFDLHVPQFIGIRDSRCFDFQDGNLVDQLAHRNFDANRLGIDHFLYPTGTQ